MRSCFCLPPPQTNLVGMCSDGNSLVDELAPGNMPHTATFLKDPFPLWKPPRPEAKLEKVGWGLRLGGWGCWCWHDARWNLLGARIVSGVLVNAG